MDIYTAITTRRSIRKYTGQPVSQGMLQNILNAGFCAPSAQNHRPWHFVVVDDKEILLRLDTTSKYGHMIKNSAFCIVVCGDAKTELEREYTYQDCSAAIQNMLLCAHGEGLGAVWCGIYSKGAWYAAIKELLGMPAEAVPVGLVAFGFPAEQRPLPDRFEKKKVHYNQW